MRVTRLGPRPTVRDMAAGDGGGRRPVHGDVPFHEVGQIWRAGEIRRPGWRRWGPPRRRALRQARPKRGWRGSADASGCAATRRGSPDRPEGLKGWDARREPAE